MSDGEPVGVSLLAKSAFQTLKMQRTPWPLREQARSHSSVAGRYRCGALILDERPWLPYLKTQHSHSDLTPNQCPPPGAAFAVNGGFASQMIRISARKI